MKIILISLLSFSIYAETYSLKGKILSNISQQPQFATVAVPKLKKKVVSDASGNFFLEFPEAGKYLIMIQAPGLETIHQEITIQDKIQETVFLLKPLRLKGSTLEVVEKSPKQIINRKNLTSNEIKSIAGTFNDPIQALSSLPGVFMSSGVGLFGFMIVRGALYRSNVFFIDNILVPRTQHYAESFAVIPAEFLSGLDLYSSGYPAEFNNASGAVLQLQTANHCSGSKFYADISSILSHLLFTVPFYDKTNNLRACITISARASYLPLMLGVLEWANQEPIYGLPEFYDFQMKLQYFLSNKSKINFLYFSYIDQYFYNPDFPKEKLPGSETALLFSYLSGVPFEMLHNFSTSFETGNQNYANTMLFSLAWNLDETAINPDFPANGKKLSNLSSLQWQYKNILELSWLKETSLFKTGIEVYGFSHRVEEFLRLLKFHDTGEYVDIRSESQVYSFRYALWLKNQFRTGLWQFTPSFATEYLPTNREWLVNPRLMLEYLLTQDQDLAIQGGHYGKFVQQNHELFKYDFSIMVDDEFTSEKAWHGSIGHEIRFYHFSLKSEFFYNYHYNVYEENTFSFIYEGLYYPKYFNYSSSSYTSFGLELLLKITRIFWGFSGWLAYYFLNNEDVSVFDFWQNEREHEHTIKAMLQKKWTVHQISFSAYWGILKMRQESYHYSDEGNLVITPANRPADDLGLNIRYTWSGFSSWGQLSIYLELIHFERIFYKPKRFEFEEEIPQAQTIPFVPNFGIEYRFP